MALLFHSYLEWKPNGSVVDRKIKVDMEAGYQSAEFAEYCHSLSYRIKTSSTRDKHAHGIAERSVGNIVNKATVAVNINNPCPQQFWPDAIEYACHSDGFGFKNKIGTSPYFYMGDSIQDATNNITENPAEDTTSVTVKAVKPRVKFVRESYLMTERKPVRNVLITHQRDHIYNLSTKGAIKTHSNIAIKDLFTDCSSLLRKSTFHPISKKTLSEAKLKAVIRSSCFVN